MHFRVEHRIQYTYTRPAQLGPHCVRLHPRLDGSLRISRHALHIHPTPALSAEGLDLDGNLVTRFWPDAPLQTLSIVSSFEGTVRRTNPFDYLVTDAGWLRLPQPAAAPLSLEAIYARRQCRSEAVATFASELAAAANHETLPFLASLAQRLSTYRQVVRDEGSARSACETLRLGEGACRDLAVLFIEACRSQGLPARFVSGYWHGLRPLDRRELHAWAEVHLPGAGWRGYDPMMGLAVADTHVPVAAALKPENAAPLEGTHNLGPGEAKLTWEIRIQVRG